MPNKDDIVIMFAIVFVIVGSCITIWAYETSEINAQGYQTLQQVVVKHPELRAGVRQALASGTISVFEKAELMHRSEDLEIETAKTSLGSDLARRETEK